MEAVLGVIGDPDGILFGVVCDHAKDGAEDSSWAIVMSFLTLTNTVGFTK
jgi:hypothetical protein